MDDFVPRAWFAGKGVVVTGAGSGLGLAIARAFAGAGSRVALVDIEHGRVDLALEALGGDQSGCIAVVADVRSRHSLESALTTACRIIGPVSVLVANAGIYPSTRLLDITEDEWDTVLETNLKGVFLTSQVAVPLMVASGGASILTLSSGVADNVLPGWAHYAASKAGVLALTKAMALEFAPYNIRVNAIMPGYIEVGGSGDHLDERYRERAKTRNLRGRPGHPDDVARAALLLASPLADYITGVVLRVDGGAGVGNLGLSPLRQERASGQDE